MEGGSEPPAPNNKEAARNEVDCAVGWDAAADVRASASVRVAPHQAYMESGRIWGWGGRPMEA